jgi:hypothetical protein
MSAFTHADDFADYYCVQNTKLPRYPYGVCGPFASKDEAAQAMDRIASVFPDAALRLERGSSPSGNAYPLDEDQADARQRLAQLRA